MSNAYFPIIFDFGLEEPAVQEEPGHRGRDEEQGVEGYTVDPPHDEVEHEAGVPTPAVQEFLGHASQDTTMRYVRKVAKDQQRIMDALG